MILIEKSKKEYINNYINNNVFTFKSKNTFKGFNLHIKNQIIYKLDFKLKEDYDWDWFKDVLELFLETV